MERATAFLSHSGQPRPHCCGSSPPSPEMTRASPPLRRLRRGWEGLSTPRSTPPTRRPRHNALCLSKHVQRPSFPEGAPVRAGGLDCQRAAGGVPGRRSIYLSAANRRTPREPRRATPRAPAAPARSSSAAAGSRPTDISPGCRRRG